MIFAFCTLNLTERAEPLTKLGEGERRNIMSRIGKKPIQIPEGIEVRIEGEKITFQNPKGKLSYRIPNELKVEIRGQKIFVSPSTQITKTTSALWGLTRAILANAILGLNQGFEKRLELQGIGYKAVLKDPTHLQLELGFSHPIIVQIPDGIQVSVEKNIIIISGIDKQKVGAFAAQLRAIRPPEPYKGKGLRYVGEKVRKKEGKKAVTAGT